MKSTGFWQIAAYCIAITATGTAHAEPVATVVEALASQFRITFDDGTVAQGLELVGAILEFQIGGQTVEVKIESIEADPIDATGTVYLHDFRNAATGEPICNPGPDGLQMGFPVSGYTSADGRFVPAASTTFELFCTSGAQGKCIRWGYHPWTEANGDARMIDYFNACVRMVRADYCGDGRSWTRDGTLIDIWDRRGILVAETLGDDTFAFEAGWTPTGAVCVAHWRVPNAGSPSCASPEATCTGAAAADAGALLFNRSQPH